MLEQRGSSVGGHQMDAPVQEPVAEVLSQSMIVLASVRDRLMSLRGTGGTPMGAGVAAPPSVSALAFDVRTIAQDIDRLVNEIGNRLGASI